MLQSYFGTYPGALYLFFVSALLLKRYISGRRAELSKDLSSLLIFHLSVSLLKIDLSCLMYQ